MRMQLDKRSACTKNPDTEGYQFHPIDDRRSDKMTGVISGIVAEVECRVARTLLQKEGEKTQTFSPLQSNFLLFLQMQSIEVAILG
jgi:hypothetical protein